MATFFQDFLQYERDFKAAPFLEWHSQATDIPIICLTLYLAFIFGAPKIIKKPFKLKKIFAVWNLGLSVFSMFGASRVVPFLIKDVGSKGFQYTICATPTNWYADGPVGLWMMFFIYSKFPELGDTFFLVLRKKNVIFLHWFHHVTVLLYCWHAYHTRIACGIWFAAMNYSVHSVMYFYYFMTNIGYYKLMRPFAPFITCGQILQMVGGMFVLLSVHSAQSDGKVACDNDPANVRLGLFMYFSYFVLFCVLFYEKYISEKIPAVQSTGCVDDIAKIDTSGFFRGDDQNKSKRA